VEAASASEQNDGVRISAKADYAVRAAAELAVSAGRGPVRADEIAKAQHIPLNFLLNILSELKLARIVQSHRGPQGGYRLARPPEEITLAEVIRAVEGPLANVHEASPEDLRYSGPAGALREVWIAVRASIRGVLESITLAHLVKGSLPGSVRKLLRDPDAWSRR
jgi:Rrf2 family protein